MENTNRFDGRSSDYSLYRPGYPAELVNVLKWEFGLEKRSTIADVGSGTGKLARLFLEQGNLVYCIEPNDDMRKRAFQDLSPYKNAVIFNGKAEQTGIGNHSIDFITAGQAFHWFDPELARKEFIRILRPQGFVVLVWNDRVPRLSGINKTYEDICRRFSKGYHASGSKAVSKDAVSNFFENDLKEFTIPNPQQLDLDGLKGRYFSASYAIGKDNPEYENLILSLDNAFKVNQEHGLVTLEYETKVFVGKFQRQ